MFYACAEAFGPHAGSLTLSSYERRFGMVQIIQIKRSRMNGALRPYALPQSVVSTNGGKEYRRGRCVGCKWSTKDC